MVKYLPPEIMEKILSRLPVKSLLRFKSACKSWNALISSHPFVRTHLLHSSQSHTGTLFIQQYSCFSRIHNFLRFRFQDRQFHVHPENHTHNFILWLWCSCNGILLLENRSRHTLTDGDGDLILWNPSMRKITKLFLPLEMRKMIKLSLPLRCVSYGLCYDPATVDLKVVVFYGDINYAVYSCKNKSWSKQKQNGVIANSIMYSTIYAREGEGVCVDGALYWIILRNDDLGSLLWGDGDLLCFESEGDKLKRVQRPGDLKESDEFCLISLRGRLCAWSCSEGQVRIWMREEGEGEEVWRDFMRIEDHIPHPYSQYYWRQPLYVDVGVEENEIIMIWLEWRRGIMVYHPREKTYQEFDLHRNENENADAVAFLFSSVNSLLFFDQYPLSPTENADALTFLLMV